MGELRLHDRALHLFLQRTPKYSQSLKAIDMADLQRIDMGIAMSHLELAAREQGLEGEWISEPPDLGALPPGTEYIATWQDLGSV